MKKGKRYVTIILVVLLMVNVCGCGLGKIGSQGENGKGDAPMVDVSNENNDILEGESNGNPGGEIVGDSVMGPEKEPETQSEKQPETQITENQQEVIDAYQKEIPGEDNWYVVEVPGGMEVQYDLDGDGKEELLYYATTLKPEGNRQVSTMLIGQKEWNVVFNGTSVEESFFGVVDLVADDSYLELALYDKNISGDKWTHFYRYNDGKLSLMGTVPGHINIASRDSGEGYLDGRGNIYSVFNLQLLAGVSAPGQWKVTTEEQIAKVNEELYCTLCDTKHITVDSELKLYMERNREAEYIVVTPSQVSVDIQATDDKEWLLISVGQNNIGWIPKETLDTMGYLNSAEIFKNK